MTFIELQRRVAKILGLLDGTTILSGRDITADDIKNAINDVYLERVLPRFNNQQYWNAEKTAYCRNYSTSFTVDAASTGNTLKSTTNLFTQDMVGSYVKNVTDDETTYITKYIDATTVEVNDDGMSDWTGDTVKFIDKIQLLNGIADLYQIVSLFVRYSESDTYVRAQLRLRGGTIQTGYESASNPIYFLTTHTDVDGNIHKGVELMPQFTDVDDNAIKVVYVQHPSELSNDSDEPLLPPGHHTVLVWGAIEECAIIRSNMELATYAMRRFERQLDELLQTVVPNGMDNSAIPRIPRRAIRLNNRDI